MLTSLSDKVAHFYLARTLVFADKVFTSTANGALRINGAPMAIFGTILSKHRMGDYESASLVPIVTTGFSTLTSVAPRLWRE